MKTLLTLLLSLLSFSILIAQNSPTLPSQANSQWKTNGNNVDTNQFIGSKNERPVVFKSNNTERFRITPEGNIGIGTSIPEAKLDVNGNVIFRDDITIFNTPITLDPINIRLLGVEPNGGVSTATTTELLDVMYGPCDLVDQNGNPIPLYNPHWSNGLNKIYVDCGPVNVGIGTDSPNSRLDVRGVTFSSKIAIGSANPVQQQEYFHLTNPSQDPNNSTDVFVIDNPLKSLLKLNNQGLLSSVNIENQGTITSNSVFVNGSGNNQILFSVEHNGYKLFRIDHTGLVRSRQMKIDTDTWPDYVFDESYKLKSIEEIDNYIKENGHLPGVPNANEVISNGIDVAKMDEILLKKIEELTLLLIQQNEEIKKLKEQLDLKK